MLSPQSEADDAGPFFQLSLASLHMKRQITLEVAMQRSSNADELKELIERGSGLNEAYGGQARPARACEESDHHHDPLHATPCLRHSHAS